MTAANDFSSCHWRAGQTRFGQRVNTPGPFSVGVAHDGHVGRRRGDRAAIGPLDRVRSRRDDLRDHVARAQDDHVVADAHVLAREVLLVVQRGELDRHAADVDRLQHGERVQVAELAHVPLDAVQPRDRRGRRELPRDRPARVAADHAEAALQLEVVDLHDDAVDLEVERAASLLPGQALGDDLVLGVEQPHVLVHAEAVLAQPLERLPVRAEPQPLGDADRRSTTSTAGARRPARGRAGGSCPPPSCAGS